MTRFALAGKCDLLGASGSRSFELVGKFAVEAFSNPSSCIKDASPSIPAPSPERFRICRLVKNIGGTSNSVIVFSGGASVDVNEFIQTKKNLTKVGDCHLQRIVLLFFCVGFKLALNKVNVVFQLHRRWIPCESHFKTRPHH